MYQFIKYLSRHFSENVDGPAMAIFALLVCTSVYQLVPYS